MPSRRTPDRAQSPDSGRILDRHVGRRLARRRRETGKTVADLAAEIDAVPDDLAAFERGDAAMDARHLHALSRALGVPVVYFFENLPAISPPGIDDMPEADRIAETARFVDAYYRIGDDAIRRDILALLKAVAARK